ARRAALPPRDRAVRGPARPRPGLAGRSRTATAPARLHAREARPLLRPLRPTVVRGAAGGRRARLGLAGEPPRRGPLRGKRRLPAGGPLLRPCPLRRRLAAPRGLPRWPDPARALPRPLLL